MGLLREGQQNLQNVMIVYGSDIRPPETNCADLKKDLGKAQRGENANNDHVPGGSEDSKRALKR